MRILIAGSSGFLGSRLVRFLHEDGHKVRRLVRREPRAGDETRWDPGRGRVDEAAITEADVVVNLAGANVGGKRWTPAYKRELHDSRIDTTATLARAIAATGGSTALLNSSAVGFYGDTGDRAIDERAPAGTGFLADLCRDWEAATAPAEAAGVRVVHLRTGLPLDSDGGLLKPLVPIFRLGAGGKLGSGDQYLPWISLPDWLAAVRFLLNRPEVAGPVNLTGPNPVTNAAFTRALARQLRRPALVPVPPLALRVALGEFADEALASQRVLPGVLTKAGFDFRYRDVTSALRWAVDHAD
ncbi:TIGR01777 family protein [Planosporangium flavigriseum]|uniref:Epimerase n=1 Tax=Planosporangium flavigriseum TaxID=373681 RepID=A0A8J3PK97_9ACTN|nr:TIGR01777 family oxidoreductase [Planosporangium flavigriseum]NJC63326.1 TIGR01777 family protein [Planosporangium flavigriseum]GIG72602.1 epimerase [Planosporangium flavigriseum]